MRALYCATAGAALTAPMCASTASATKPERRPAIAPRRPCLLLRGVARLPQPAVPGYHELDVRLAWQARPGVEPALVGRNLLQARHPEFGEADLRQLAERHVFASATLRF